MDKAAVALAEMRAEEEAGGTGTRAGKQEEVCGQESRQAGRTRGTRGAGQADRQMS